MSYTININECGVPVFNKGDVRRLFIVIAAIEELEHATLNNITARTGYPKASLADALKKILAGELGVTVTKNGSAYHITDRGKFLQKITFEKIMSTTN